jgi:alpha-tubulin suppressor-like RCC1 family protein
VTVGTFESLSLGNYHTCDVVSGGETYCWGFGGGGQLGDGTYINFRYTLGEMALDLDPSP